MDEHADRMIDSLLRFQSSSPAKFSRDNRLSCSNRLEPVPKPDLRPEAMHEADWQGARNRQYGILAMQGNTARRLSRVPFGPKPVLQQVLSLSGSYHAGLESDRA